MLNTVRFDLVDADQFVATVGQFVSCGQSHVIHFLAADPTQVARRETAFRELLNQADLNVSDGAPVVWGLRLLGHPARRITATDGVHLLAGWSVDRNLGHFFFGGAPGVAQEMSKRLGGQHGIRIAGATTPPFRPLEESEYDDAAEAIRASRADLLWIGLGAPKQNYVAEQLRAREAAPVILTIGAAFDFIAGTKRRAPDWMQSLGLEWLHRLASEPRRLWRRYLVGNSRFVAGVLVDYSKSRRSGRRAAP